MFKRFTVQARDVVVRARQEAQRLRHDHIGSEHLLLAMATDATGVAGHILGEAGLDADRIRSDIERLAVVQTPGLDDDDAAALQTIGIDVGAVLAKIEESFGPEALRPPAAVPQRESVWGKWRGGGGFTPRAKKILELSLRESVRLGHNHLGVEHILLGLLRDGQGQAARILTDAGLAPDDLYAATLAALKPAA